MVVAAESGETRASRLRALSAERQAEADKYAALAAAVEKGNHGERVVAELLDVLDGAGWCVLHDRYKPGSTANLDHVVVGPPGVFVIDAKNWKPAPLRFDERGMSLRGYRKDEELRAAADCARLVLQRAVSAHAGLPAVGVLAFVQDMGLASAHRAPRRVGPAVRGPPGLADVTGERARPGDGATRRRDPRRRSATARRQGEAVHPERDRPAGVDASAARKPRWGRSAS